MYEIGRWLYWNGKFWDVDRSGKIISRLAEITVRSIYKEAADCEDRKTREAIAEHARKSEGAQKIKAILQLAETRIPVAFDELDKESWFLNCLNGVIDLRTGQLLDHDPGYLIDKMVTAEYDPLAECPNWMKFMDLIMEGDQDMIFFLQKVVGYCLTGHTDERALFVLHGTGKNGKSTFTETIANLMEGYAQKISSDALLMKRYGDDPKRDLATLRSIRFVYASETAEGRRLNENKIKELCGDRDTVEGRFLYHERFEYIPQFKLFLHTNHRPSIRGTDEAIWDRVKLIPFNYRFSEPIPRRQIDQMFADEMAGILRWAVDGCLLWLSDGLKTPDQVTTATQSYREESDLLGEFLEERCLIDIEAIITKSELYNSYADWAEENKEKSPLSKRAFGSSILERGFGDITIREGGAQKRAWQGIKLQ